MTAPTPATYLQEQLAGLALSAVEAAGPGPALRARAAGWHNQLLRLGVRLPLYFVHDLGLLLCTPRSELRVGAAPGRSGPAARYQALLHELAQAAPIEATAALRLRDELIAAVLVRTCAELGRRLDDALAVGGADRGAPAVELPLHPAAYAGPLPAPPGPRSPAQLWLQLVTTEPQPLHLQTAVELIDQDTLRLLSLSAGGAELVSAGQGGVDLLELLAVLKSPEARDIVRFSLELLPALLEAPRPSGAATFPTGGYAALQGRGSVDSLVLSELASDDEIFYTRYALDELLYYGREQRTDPPRRLHHVLVDASPSMRGLRQVFARGLAWSLCKRLSLLGGEVVVRFFDARLHEPVSAQRSPARLLPYLLGFRSQRGRNYGRVFRDLAGELAAPSRDAGARRRSVTVYLITHGECHIPLATVRALRRYATLYGIFTLPSSELQLEYLPLLHYHQVVSEQALGSLQARRERALSIVGDAADRSHSAAIG